MSETNKKHMKRRFLPYLSMAALLTTLVSGQMSPADGQDLSAYGAEMCAELGIPAERCSLSAQGRSAETSRAAGDKTATLVEHGRRVCTQEGVPMEDCKALPSPYRKTDRTVLPASSFLTTPERIPAPDPGLMPVPMIADAPIPARQQAVRYARPAPPGELPLRYVAPPPVDPGFRNAGPPLPPIDPGFRYADPLPPPGEPAFLYAEPLAPVADRAVRAGRQERLRRQERPRELERFREPERFGRRERLRGDEPSGRCLRAVRYSRPPSYRYVTC